MDPEEKIYHAAISQFLQLGIRGVSMDDLCRNLGISKKTIYKYVSSKEELLNKAILQKQNEDFAAMLEIRKHAKNAIDEIVQCTKLFLQFLREMKPAFLHDLKKYYAESWSLIESLHNSFQLEFIKENIDKGKKEGLYREGINTEIIAKLYNEMSLSLADEQVFSLKMYSRPRLYKQVTGYHLHGIMTDKGRQYLENKEIQYYDEK